jgi:hypothetical protein
VKGWTQAGHSYRSRPRDCRTVRVRHPGKPTFRTGRVVRLAEWPVQPEKPLEWHHDQPGPDASMSTNRPPLRDARRLRSRNLARKTSGRRGGPVRAFDEVRDAVSQETCHPQGHRARSRERRSRCQHGGCHGFLVPLSQRQFLPFSPERLRISRRTLRLGSFHDIDDSRTRAGPRRRPFRQIDVR